MDSEKKREIFKFIARRYREIEQREARPGCKKYSERNFHPQKRRLS